MTQINAYLHFNGNCREAMTFQIFLPVEKLDTR